MPALFTRRSIAAERGDDPGDEPLDCVVRRHVSTDSPGVGTVHAADLVDDREDPLGVEVDHRDARPLVGEEVGRGPAHAAGRAGDDRHLPGNGAAELGEARHLRRGQATASTSAMPPRTGRGTERPR